MMLTAATAVINPFRKVLVEGKAALSKQFKDVISGADITMLEGVLRRLTIAGEKEEVVQERGSRLIILFQSGVTDPEELYKQMQTHVS